MDFGVATESAECTETALNSSSMEDAGDCAEPPRAATFVCPFQSSTAGTFRFRALCDIRGQLFLAPS